MNGKGDKPRPLSVPREEFNNKWDEIFKKQEDKKPPQNPPPIDMHDLEGRN